MRASRAIWRASSNAFTGYAGAVMADSPIVYWRLGESSGTVAADSSGNGHDGSYNHNPTLGAASLLSSDPTNKAMQVAANSNQSVGLFSASWMNFNFITVECLVNFSSAADATNGDAIVSRYDAGGFNWLLWRNLSGQLAVQLRNTGGTAYNVADSATVVLGTTYHVAFTFNGSSVVLYKNGSSVGSVAATGTLQTGTAPIEVARYSAQDITVPGATIDEVAIYTSALSSGRIAAHYAAV